MAATLDTLPEGEVMDIVNTLKVAEIEDGVVEEAGAGSKEDELDHCVLNIHLGETRYFGPHTYSFGPIRITPLSRAIRILFSVPVALTGRQECLCVCLAAAWRLVSCYSEA